MAVAQEKSDHAAEIAQQVMQRIAKDGLTPNPDVFSVLFAHYNGDNPEISRPIDAATREQGKLNDALCESLYDAHLSVKKERAYVTETARKVQEAIAEISNAVRGAGIAHKEYNKSLMKQSDDLNSTTDLGEIRKMVNSLVDDTHKMVVENQKLEEKLHLSSNELQQMRTDMQSLKQESLTDVLTGIGNRKFFDNELRAKSKDALEHAKPMSLIMLDIDYFKIFNDTFGHQVGDQVLRLVAKTISEGLRPTELLARYGGEEFVVIAPGLKLRDAEKLADKLRERIAAKDIVNQSKNETLGRLSVSLGVAQLHPGEPMTSLIERADRALYKAKAAGRNAVVAVEYDKSLHAHHTDIVIDVTH